MSPSAASPRLRYADDQGALPARYTQVRSQTEALVAPLSAETCCR